jgi:predicted DNA-binding protein YlxM (UPF0122 family)
MKFDENYPLSVIHALNKSGYAVPPITPVYTKDRIDGMLYAISLLPNRSRVIIQQHYGNNLTYEKIGEELHITRQRVQQLVKKALRELMRSNRSIYLYNGLEGARELIEKTKNMPLIEELDVYKPEPDYISKLRLSKRTYNTLIRNNIKTIGQLMSMSEEDLYNLPRMGEKTLHEIMTIPPKEVECYAKAYKDNFGLFEKLDKSNDFTEEEKETIKAAFSELHILKMAQKIRRTGDLLDALKNPNKPVESMQ